MAGGPCSRLRTLKTNNKITRAQECNYYSPTYTRKLHIVPVGVGTLLISIGCFNLMRSDVFFFLRNSRPNNRGGRNAVKKKNKIPQETHNIPLILKNY